MEPDSLKIANLSEKILRFGKFMVYYVFIIERNKF